MANFLKFVEFFLNNKYLFSRARALADAKTLSDVERIFYLMPCARIKFYCQLYGLDLIRLLFFLKDNITGSSDDSRPMTRRNRKLRKLRVWVCSYARSFEDTYLYLVKRLIDAVAIYFCKLFHDIPQSTEEFLI